MAGERSYLDEERVSVSALLEALTCLLESEVSVRSRGAKRKIKNNRLRRFGKPNTSRIVVKAQHRRKHTEKAKTALGTSPFEAHRQTQKAKG